MARGTITVEIVSPFFCYRDPGKRMVDKVVDGQAVQVEDDVSGPKSEFEAGQTVTDATDEEAENWIAKGLARRPDATPARGRGRTPFAHTAAPAAET